MEYVLMNKNVEVLVALYDEEIKGFSDIVCIKNIDYAPLILKKAYLNNDNFRLELNNWFKGRGIPTWRDKLDILLNRLNISAPEELLDKVFALSLSDQYWIKRIDDNIKYDDINFFDNDFDSVEFSEISFSNGNDLIVSDKAFKTPNNTTDGMLRKCWVIENGKRYLLKSGYKNDILQPFNEVLASLICDRLGFSHASYTLEVVNGKVVSKCECFINKDTELVTAHQILFGTKKYFSIEDYNNYIEILQGNGIENAREKVENMYILDFLIMNEDRHLNNFGIIRDVNTLKWLDVAPIFDNGQALNVIMYDEDEVVISNEGRFFYNTFKFDDIIKIVVNNKRIDINSLDGVVEEFDDLLHRYQNITGITDGRINKICILLNRQINKLKNIIDEEV